MQAMFVPKIIMVPVGIIQAAPFNPKNRTEENKRLALLKESIVRLGGIVYPLVISNDNRLIDGHRRLACARSIGMKEVPCIVLPLELQQAFVELNNTQMPITGGDWTEIVYHGVSIDNLFPTHRKALREIYDFAGDEGIAAMATSGKPFSPKIVHTVRSIQKYIQDDSDETARSILMWLIKHNMQTPTRKAMESKIDRKELERAIRLDKKIINPYRMAE